MSRMIRIFLSLVAFFGVAFFSGNAVAHEFSGLARLEVQVAHSAGPVAQAVQRAAPVVLPEVQVTQAVLPEVQVAQAAHSEAPGAREEQEVVVAALLPPRSHPPSIPHNQP